jgi:hypothetical protein
LLYKYFRKTVVQHKTNKRIKFVVRKQSGFFITFTLHDERTYFFPEPIFLSTFS